jgi:hypothetical protein
MIREGMRCSPIWVLWYFKYPHIIRTLFKSSDALEPSKVFRDLFLNSSGSLYRADIIRSSYVECFSRHKNF